MFAGGAKEPMSSNVLGNPLALIRSVREMYSSSSPSRTLQLCNLVAHPVGLTLKADPFRVRLYAGAELVADHPRCYAKGQVIEDWRHYVPLLLEKPFAIPWVSALRQGALPDLWEQARQELVVRRSDGNHEFARLLDLCLTHSQAAVEATLALAREQPGWSADTVRQVLRWAEETAPPAPPLDPATYPAYQVDLPPPHVAAYNQLLEVQP